MGAPLTPVLPALQRRRRLAPLLRRLVDAGLELPDVLVGLAAYGGGTDERELDRRRHQTCEEGKEGRPKSTPNHHRRALTAPRRVDVVHDIIHALAGAPQLLGLDPLLHWQLGQPQLVALLCLRIAQVPL